MDLKIKPENTLQALMHLTIQTNVYLLALSDVLIEAVSKSDEDAIENLKFLNAQLVSRQSEVILHLNILYGDVGLNDMSGA